MFEYMIEEMEDALGIMAIIDHMNFISLLSFQVNHNALQLPFVTFSRQDYSRVSDI